MFYYTLQTYYEYLNISITAEELIHKVLFNKAIDEKCRLVKILIDVGWHHQPYEEFAETVAKIVGFVYSDSRRRMLFENLRIKTLDAMWLPAYSDYHKFMNDLLRECEVKGIRACKSDAGAAKGAKAFRTMEEKSKQTAIPYDWSILFL